MEVILVFSCNSYCYNRENNSNSSRNRSDGKIAPVVMVVNDGNSS